MIFLTIHHLFASGAAAPSPAKSTLSPSAPATGGAASPAKPAAATPAKSPAKTPAKSPAKQDDNKIEIKKDSGGLGLSILGGEDTPLVKKGRS